MNPRRPGEQWPTILELTPGDWATLKKIKRNLLEAARANGVTDPAVNARSPFPE